jgi:rhodanese-related sulfurtransferase
MSEEKRFHELDAPTLKAMADRGEVVIVDVREPYEYGFERIPGALLFPLATFNPACLPVGGDKTIVFHCAAGRRSAMAAQKLLDSGAGEAYHLKGGIGAWKEANLPLVAIEPTTGAIVKRNG